MTQQRSERLVHRGKEYAIHNQPLDSYLSETSAYPFVAPSSALWRGYQGTWEVRDDELHLVQLDGTGPGYSQVGLDELFPGHRGSVEATWYSCELLFGDNPWSGDTPWFILTIRQGKLLLEETVGEAGRVLKSRLTDHVRTLFGDQEWSFLQAIRDDLDDLNPKLIYADYLEERDDPRGQVLRKEAEHLGKSANRRQPYAIMNGDPLRGWTVDPRDITWFWRKLVGLPVDDQLRQEYRKRLEEMQKACGQFSMSQAEREQFLEDMRQLYSP